MRLGYASLIVFFVVLTFVQISQLRQAANVRRSLTRAWFYAATDSFQLLRALSGIEEYASRFIATRSRADSIRLAEMVSAFDDSLQHIQDRCRSPEQEAAIEPLRRSWNEFRRRAVLQTAILASLVPASTRGLRPELLDLFGQLRLETLGVIWSTQDIVQAQIEKAQAGSFRLMSLWWCAALISLISSVMVAFHARHSLSRSFGKLRVGTRAIAEGNFAFRLESAEKDGFGSLADEFNAMAAQLSHFDQLKKDFVSSVSHELKSPLASMEETVRLLLSRIPGQLNSKQERLLELTLQSGKRLKSLIRNLLALARIESGVKHHSFRERDLTVLVRAILEEFEILSSQKGVAIEVEILRQPLIVVCDEHGVLRVLSNLLENALKFSPQGTVVRICVQSLSKSSQDLPTESMQRLTRLPLASDFALVSIADSGPGVSDAEKETIFEKFYQVKQGQTSSGEGIGLGLQIARVIAEAHEGAIWVEDNPGKGSVFQFLLPQRMSGDWN